VIFLNPFKYTNGLSGVSTRLLKQTGSYRIIEVSFPSAIDTGYSKNSTVIGDYYVPNTEFPVPLAVLVHGMGDYSRIPCRALAGSLVKQNIACFVPYLTIHSKRLPLELKPGMPYLSPEEWYNVYRLSVIDIRQILDWAMTRREIDSKKLFISGISFGGFVSTITMGMDERIKAGVFVVTGGNANKLTWTNKEGKYRDRYKRSEAEHFQVISEYELYLDQVKKYGFENVPAKHISFLTDPLTFADNLKDRPVLMINAKYDKYIPVESATELWQAIGKPDIKWYPSGHVTLWFWYPSIRTAVSEFFGLFNKPSRKEQSFR
jgi:esterase/lipase